MPRAIILVMDSVGIGALPDAHLYGDEKSNTLVNLAKALGGISLPSLAKLGLSLIEPIKGLEKPNPPLGAYGKMAEKSKGKDTTTGHWEMCGIILEKPFPTYPNGFPPSVIEAFCQKIGQNILGNIVSSGTKIIEDLGAEHLKTGYPIVYTSADSVFQIAAHEEIIPLPRLYQICQIARELLQGEHGVGRVIARPFIGEVGFFTRTTNRRDFSLLPPPENLLSLLKENGHKVYAVGKIEDIFAGQGISEALHTKGNADGVAKTLSYLENVQDGLIFTNLVDFDMIYGHRNNPQGYAKALEELDSSLNKILASLKEDDVLFITADHGCDPTTPGTDHSREYVPLLVYGKKIKVQNLGIRQSFADLGATIAQMFSLRLSTGKGFWEEIKPEIG